MGFDGIGYDSFLGDLHETAEEDKGKKLIFKGFRSLLPVNAKDVEMNLLHVIFYLKGVLVGKEYFKINHFLPLAFNLTWGPTLLSKSIIPKPALK